MDLVDRQEVILMIMMIMNAARLVWIGVEGSICGGFGSGEVAVHFCCRLLSLSHILSVTSHRPIRVHQIVIRPAVLSIR